MYKNRFLTPLHLFLIFFISLIVPACNLFPGNQIIFKETDNKNITENETIVFLHTNDHHFDINLHNELSAKIAEIRNTYDNVYLFDAGDVMVRHPNRWIENGTPREDPEWYYERALKIINAKNELQYDAMTLGNHEFDYIQDYTLNALQAADFPLLSSNVEVTTTKFPKPDSHLMLQTSGGYKIAVLGLSVTSGSKDGIRQHDIFDTARQYMFLRNESTIFVALTHIGLANDVRLAEEFNQLDVIIGGHSHHLIEEAVMVNGVLIAQAGGNPHVVSENHPVYLGKIIVTIENGKITDKKGHVIHISETP
jgi:5'-nucleotidase / UDP-sugar diphosphatase